MGNLRLCICIPTYRRVSLLQHLLYDMSLQTVKPETLVIVDGDPGSGEVLNMLSGSTLSAAWRTVYVPSNHANVAYQRYLGWKVARQTSASILLYLDDDLRIEQRDAVERVILPLTQEPGVVGVTARIISGGNPDAFREAPVLRDRSTKLGPILSRMVKWLGSKIPPGGLTPTGNRRLPEGKEEHEAVHWLYGRVMAYTMDAMDEDCFSGDLFALCAIHCGMGEDTFLSRRVGAKGRLLIGWNATFLHPDDALPCAYPIQAHRLGYAIAYSRRLLNDDCRYPDPPTLADRLALVRSYLGNILLSWGQALVHPARHRFAYAWGYTVGAARGLIQRPSARRLTPYINWARDAEEAVRAAIWLGEGI